MQNSAVQKVVDWSGLRRDIGGWGTELGFQQVAVADCDLSHAEPRLAEWLARGWHGDMDYMARHGVKRSRPAELVPGTLRVIAVRLNYTPPAARDSWSVINDGAQAFISRYATGRDYHKVLRNRLQELAERASYITGIPAREILETILGRERLGTTGVGPSLVMMDLPFASQPVTTRRTVVPMIVPPPVFGTPRCSNMQAPQARCSLLHD